MKITIYDIYFHINGIQMPDSSFLFVRNSNFLISFTVSMWIMLDQVAALLLMEVQDSLASFYKAAWAMGAKEQEDENHFCIDLTQMMRWSILRGPFQEPRPLQVKSGKP